MRRSRVLVVAGLALVLVGAGVVFLWPAANDYAVPEPASYAALDPEVAALLRSMVSSVREEPGDINRWVRLGMSYEANEEPVLAAETYSIVTERAPGDSRGWFGLAKVQAARGAMTEAEAAMRRAIELEPEYAPSHWLLGYWLFEQGQLDEAAQHFQRATHADESDPAAWFGLARVHLARGEVDSAVTMLEWLSNRPPPHGPYAWQLLSGAYRRLGRTNDAETARLRGHGASPNFRDSWDIEVAKLERGFGAQLNQAKALLAFGRAEESIQLLTTLQARRPDDPMVLSNLATAYRAVRNFEKSRQVLEDALALQSSFVHAHFGLALTSWSERRDEASARNAMAHLEQTLALNASYAPAHALRGEILAFLGNHDEAAEAFEKAYALQPQQVMWRHQAAQSLMQAGAWSEAAVLLDAVTRQSPSLAEAWSAFSIALAALGRDEEARAALNEALRLAPTAAHTAEAQQALTRTPKPKAVGP